MLIISGTATGGENVLASTELATLYSKGNMTIRAIAPVDDAATAPTVTMVFRSARTTLCDPCWVPTPTKSVEYVGTQPGATCFSGNVPAGALSLIFSDTVYWEAILH